MNVSSTGNARLIGAEGGEPAPAPAPKRRRLASLDAVRGMTVVLMIFVDEMGGAYPGINHSPWNNVTLADFVMPWFLFMVGTSLTFSLKRFRGARSRGTRFVVVRSLKLFALGVLLQGGGFPYQYVYGFNLATLRWNGILQRIGYAYFAAATIELWVPETARTRVEHPALWPRMHRSSPPRRVHLEVFAAYGWRWLIAASFVALQLTLTYGTYVPSWRSDYGFDRAVGAVGGSALLAEADRFEIACDTRGEVDFPPCTAQSFYDRMIFGQAHLGTWMFNRLAECSGCSPGAPDPTFREGCRWQPNATTAGGSAAWCFAHSLDPEGALATIPSVMSVWLGVHFGRVLGAEGLESHAKVVCHWGACAAALMLSGLGLHFGGVRMNKQLWSLSYLLFTAGTCGALLTLVYAAIDAAAAGVHPSRGRRLARRLLYPFESMGMNAILFFVWGASGLTEIVTDAVYYDPPVPGGGLAYPRAECALLAQQGWVVQTMLGGIGDPRARYAVYVCLKLGVLLGVAIVCRRVGYFWKI